MYKKVNVSIVGKKFETRYGKPALVMEDQYGGRVVVVTDDHCYVAMLKRGNDYKATSWIFQELFEEMKKLPSPHHHPE